MSGGNQGTLVPIKDLPSQRPAIFLLTAVVDFIYVASINQTQVVKLGNISPLSLQEFDPVVGI
jgi:hypothetical protein